jgi:hypothetical protein
VKKRESRKLAWAAGVLGLSSAAAATVGCAVATQSNCSALFEDPPWNFYRLCFPGGASCPDVIFADPIVTTAREADEGEQGRWGTVSGGTCQVKWGQASCGTNGRCLTPTSANQTSTTNVPIPNSQANTCTG